MYERYRAANVSVIVSGRLKWYFGNFLWFKCLIMAHNNGKLLLFNHGALEKNYYFLAIQRYFQKTGSFFHSLFKKPDSSNCLTKLAFLLLLLLFKLLMITAGLGFACWNACYVKKTLCYNIEKRLNLFCQVIFSVKNPFTQGSCSAHMLLSCGFLCLLSYIYVH